ncbi:DUF4129 domain-containing protein [Brachybacterium alimentarium]|uniref:DUF4129 domain-containing protein n=1 Tax=Brachybacterium alimentarium TaxID=47845 RepID=A0A2A3YIT9_9MICO|nr:DUF4129 domain-containing protein [Brachybacterium alimentarium]PCC35686.1 DUF4129 domain-containing protein [Brachybacterium alimentarium]PCC39213.1 DUF4129 domain-containing protein [Brachybacterium alimentarium]RCS82534.1 DUF4129 domain-containing protein [Brachybacterium alimentarium]RCS83994.1 DUF4129 domain-containing protein [Brachybacterium alimentarium]RCS89211.1 DUF4129 domain-containing protein [Brachybacterium alimentarium]
MIDAGPPVYAGPPVPDPDEARSRVFDELSKAEYDDSPGFVQWLLGVIERWLTDLFDSVDGTSTVQVGLAIALMAVLLVVVVLVLRRTGLIRRSHTLAVAPGLDADPVLSAHDLREQARTALNAGRFDDGTVLALRALVRDLEVRTLLDVTSGMTAHEAAARAAAPYPDLRGRLLRGADAFDTAAYSHRPATAKAADDLLRLAEYIAESAPDLSTADDVAAENSTPEDSTRNEVGA